MSFSRLVTRARAAPPRCILGWIEVGLVPRGFTSVPPPPAVAWSVLQPPDASLMGPSPQGACGFSSAADTNRIRDDILPGWRGLSWSNWDGGQRGYRVRWGDTCSCVCVCVCVCFSQDRNGQIRSGSGKMVKLKLFGERWSWKLMISGVQYNIFHKL